MWIQVQSQIWYIFFYTITLQSHLNHISVRPVYLRLTIKYLIALLCAMISNLLYLSNKLLCNPLRNSPIYNSTRLLFIWGIPSSNLNLETGYSDRGFSCLCSVLRVNSGLLGHENFLPCRMQFIAH